MRLEYNIYFELASAFFVLFLLLFVRTQYSLEQKRNRIFFRMMCLVLLVDVLDVVTACTISYSNMMPIVLNKILNTIYFASNGVLGYQFMNYSLQYNSDSDKKSKAKMITNVVLGIYEVILIVNYFVGCIFYFDSSGHYQHGSIYLLVYLVPYIYFFVSVGNMFLAFRRFNRRQQGYIILYLLVSASGGTLQMLFFPKVLLNVFTISLGITIVLFWLETPEFQKLQDTMEELEKAKEQAQRESASKSQFLANISHEIRTPINAILGMDEMILRESAEKATLEYAANIQSASGTLLSIVNEILDFSKVASGKMELVVEEYSLETLIGDSCKLIETRVADKDLKMELQCDETVPSKLEGDAKRIQQILVNLLTNAVKYTPSGTIILRVKWAEAKEGIKLLLSVEDTGIGISEENQKKLFDTFERFDEEKNHNIEGTGLGLSITKQLVELMNGEIGVYSEIGKGSLFYVEIPQKVMDAAPLGRLNLKKSEQQEQKVAGQKFQAPDAQILVVDDVQMNVRVLQGLLKRTKVKIAAANSGMQCLKLAAENKYDLILLDHMMPEMDGVEVFHKLREDEQAKNYATPVIALTANAIAGAKEEYEALGFDGYLSKPVDAVVLEEIVFKHLPKNKIVMEKMEDK